MLHVGCIAFYLVAMHWQRVVNSTVFPILTIAIKVFENGETGIQYLNFFVLIEYNYSLNSFLEENASTYGVNLRSHLQNLTLKVGKQFYVLAYLIKSFSLQEIT